MPAPKNLKRRGRAVVHMKTHMRKKLKFQNDTIRDAWNLKATMRQNYKQLGLVMDLNSHEEILDKAKDTVVPVEYEELTIVKATLDDPSKRPRFFVSEDEQSYLDRLSKKHGQNFKAMERDIKLNNMQHSAQHLASRFERLAQFRASSVEGAPAAGAGAPVAAAPAAPKAGDKASSKPSTSSTSAAALASKQKTSAAPAKKKKEEEEEEEEEEDEEEQEEEDEDDEDEDDEDEDEEDEEEDDDDDEEDVKRPIVKSIPAKNEGGVVMMRVADVLAAQSAAKPTSSSKKAAADSSKSKPAVKPSAGPALSASKQPLKKRK